jgi:hypothetical protein
MKTMTRRSDRDREEETEQTHALWKLHQPQRLQFPRPSVLHKKISEESERYSLDVVGLRRLVPKRSRMPLHRRDAEKTEKTEITERRSVALSGTKVFIPCLKL